MNLVAQIFRQPFDSCPPPLHVASLRIIDMPRVIHYFTVVVLALVHFEITHGTFVSHSLDNAAIACRSNLTMAGRNHSITMGAAIALAHLRNVSDPLYAQVWQQQYTLATAENECKWLFTEPREGHFDFAPCDAIASFAPLMRGHNLCWGTENPTWLMRGNFTNTTLKHLLVRHIETVVGHYRNWTNVLSWDVVNEAVSDGGKGMPLLKPSPPWYPALHDYIDIAFHAARRADPTKLLFYNDYSADELNPKSDRVYELVTGMMARGVPIDGIGLQMHLDPILSPVNYTSIALNIARFGALGLVVHITEMDVACLSPFCNETTEAAVYAGVLGACLSQPGVCTVFETWGFTDKYSWLTTVPWNPKHLDFHPLPFDSQYNPKPAYTSLVDRLCSG